jgi:hypothetical protein
MPIPVQQFQAMPSGLGEALSKALQGGMAGYDQSLKMQQAKQNMKQQQMIMDALPDQMKQQLMQAQAQLAKTQADTELSKQKTLGIPQTAQLQERKAGIEQATKVLEAAKRNPELMRNPQFASQAAMASQMLTSGIGQQQDMQPQQDSDLVRQLQEAAQSREEKETIPTQVQNQRVRALSADKMLQQVKGDLGEVLPYLGGANNIENVIANYSQATGLDIGSARRKINTLFNKKIPLLSEEMAAGLGTPAAEKAHERLANITDPSKEGYGNVKQIMDNLQALEDMHKQNFGTLFMSPAEQSKQALKSLSKDVPRETKQGDVQFSQSDIMAELARRGLA